MTHRWLRALTLLIGLLAAGACSAATDVAKVFITTRLDSLQPYVQSAVSLQVQVYSDQRLYEATVDLAGNADARVQRVGQDVSSLETRDGRTYQVITRHYLVQPQRSGEIRLAGPLLKADVADGGGSFNPFLDQLFGQLQIPGAAGGLRTLQVRGEPVSLFAQPRPPGRRSGDWLPAQQLTLDDIGPRADAVIAVGQPVTRRVRLAAVGLAASQLPDLSVLTNPPPGLKAHAEPATLVDEVLDGHIVGRREQDLTLLAERPGRFELPEVRVAWWDVATSQAREAVLPALTLEVAAGPARAVSGAASAPAGPTARSQAAASGGAAAGRPTGPTPDALAATPAAALPATDDPQRPWFWISLGLGVLWLATLGAWVATHRAQRRPALRASAAAGTVRAADASVAGRWGDVAQACRDHAARPARDALLAWARANWPTDPPAGLHALARRLDDPALTACLRELERACLEDRAWNAGALQQSLSSLRSGSSPSRTAPGGLPGLYAEP